MAYTWNARRSPLEKATREIHSLRRTLAAQMRHVDMLEAEIGMLRLKLRRANDRRVKRDRMREMPCYVASLTPEQRAFRHGDDTGRLRLEEAANEAGRIARRNQAVQILTADDTDSSHS